MQEPLEAYESSKAHQDLEEASFLAVEEACQTFLGVAEAFSCLEAEEAFWEGSSSSTMRDKLGYCSLSASRHC